MGLSKDILGFSKAVCVEINNCTNEEGKWNCVCTFNMGERKFKKKVFC